VNVTNRITFFEHPHIFEQCSVIVFFAHKETPKVFCPNFWGHFISAGLIFNFRCYYFSVTLAASRLGNRVAILLAVTATPPTVQFSREMLLQTWKSVPVANSQPLNA